MWASATMAMQKLEDKLWESDLVIHHVGADDQIEVIVLVPFSFEPSSWLENLKVSP